MTTVKSTTKKVSKNRIKKQTSVKSIAEKIQKAKSIVFIDYKGLTVAQVTELRVEMRKAGFEYKVYKNNLVKIAFKNCGIEVPDDVLVSTLAVAFNYDDEVGAAKLLADAAAKTKKTEFKFGVVNGKFANGAYVKALASIPSREVLISKLMFLLKAPVQKMAICISEIAKKQV